MRVEKILQITRASFSRIRSTRTQLTARGGTDPPQPIPTVPMRGRRKLLIMNFGVFAASVPNHIRVLIGGAEVNWTTGGPAEPLSQAFGLDLYESVELPISDSALVFALVDPTETPGADADIRTIELG